MRDRVSGKGEGIAVDIEMGYSTDREVFYSSFYSSNSFSDVLIEQLIKD